MLLFIILMLYLGSFAVKFACRRAWKEAKKRAALRFRSFARRGLAVCLMLSALALAAAILTGRMEFDLDAVDETDDEIDK